MNSDNNKYSIFSPASIWFIIAVILMFPFSDLIAQNNIDKLIDSLTVASNKSEKVRLSNKLARELSLIDWERALHYLDYSEKEALESGSEELKAEFYVTAGDIYYSKDVLDVALDYYLKAYKFFSKNNNLNKKYELENDLAVVYARMNNKDKALEYFKRVYEYQKKINDSVSLAQILNNIGNLYLKKIRIHQSIIFLNP